MVAVNRYTQFMQSSFDRVMQDPERARAFRESITSLLEENAMESTPDNVGLVLVRSMVECLDPYVSKCPDFVGDILAHVICTEVDWSHIARVCMTDHNSN